MNYYDQYEVFYKISMQSEGKQLLAGTNKKLIETFQQKIHTKIAEVWGE